MNYKTQRILATLFRHNLTVKDLGNYLGLSENKIAWRITEGWNWTEVELKQIMDFLNLPWENIQKLFVTPEPEGVMTYDGCPFRAKPMDYTNIMELDDGTTYSVHTIVEYTLIDKKEPF